MPTIAPPSLVVGAPRIPLPFGLLSVLAPREGSADRWENGVQWETLTCEPVGGIGAADCDPAAIVGLPKDLDALPAPIGDASPFTVYGHWTCSPIGNTLQHAQDQAVAHLTTTEEARVEQALWTGDLGNTPNLAGANGYAAPTSVGSFTDGVLALATLEQAFAEAYGSQGVAHMSRRTASWLIKHGAVQVRGSRLYTVLGTPVVAGTGYGDDRIVFTGQLFGYRSEIFPAVDDLAQLLDREQNNLHAIAERSYLVGFDECGIVAATIDIPAPVAP